ncbi:MAG: hypothetical protein LBC51_06225 [Treponema sp.]|nr:hypothetical protein [Treponema sp.]
MRKKILEKLRIIGVLVFVLLSGELWLYRDMFSFTPWKTTGTLKLVAYGTGNHARLGIVENAHASVLVLNAEKELLYQLQAKPRSTQSFSRAESLQFDEADNLYILDTHFGGVLEESYERILKYTADGVFQEEIYRYGYINEDFSITQGKLRGLSYYRGALYLVRLGDQGFWLEQVQTTGTGTIKSMAFFEYPQAFREIAYAGIQAEQERLNLITKAGLIKQYDFSGTLTGTWTGAAKDSLPWGVTSWKDGGIIYTDLSTAEIVLLDPATGTRQVLFTGDKAHPYYLLEATQAGLFAVSFGDSLLICSQEGAFETWETYDYAPWFLFKRKVLFALLLLDIPPLLLSLALLLRALLRLQGTKAGTLIFTLGMSIALGGGLASVLVIKKMQEQYNESTFTRLENISRFMASRIDSTLLQSLTSPRDYDREAYQVLQDQLYEVFAQTQFTGKRVYQRIWKIQDGIRYALYDLEGSLGMFYPYAQDREDDPRHGVLETGAYVQGIEVNASGRWLYACGPLVDATGAVRALIETGYDLGSVQEELRNILIKTLVMVGVVLLGSLWFLILCLLILGGKKHPRPPVSGLLGRACLLVSIKNDTSLMAYYEQGEVKGIAIDLLYEIGRRLHKTIVVAEPGRHEQEQADIIAGDIVKTPLPPRGWKCSRSYARYRYPGNPIPQELCFLYPENSPEAKPIDAAIKLLSKEAYLTRLRAKKHPVS